MVEEKMVGAAQRSVAIRIVLPDRGATAGGSKAVTWALGSINHSRVSFLLLFLVVTSDKINSGNT